MGLLHAPIETIWFDAVEVEIVAGTIQYFLYRAEPDEEGRTIRRLVCRTVTTIEVAQQGNADAAIALMQAGRPRPSVRFAHCMQ